MTKPNAAMMLGMYDQRIGFIERFLRYKYMSGSKLPVSWQEAVDWLRELDAARNEANIAFEKIFYEHMSTCLHPIIVPLTDLPPVAKGKKDS
jgi:hypothetical protein